MRETVARIAKPAVIALAGAAAMLSVGGSASADTVPGNVLDAVGEVPGAAGAMPVAAAGTVAEVAGHAPVAGDVVAGAPVVGDLAANHEPMTEAVGRVPGKAIGGVAGGSPVGHLPIGH